MDAVEYLKTLYRMCTKSPTCDDCPIYKGTRRNCGLVYNNAKMLVDSLGIVEQWAEEHPVRTRQSVFLERYPNVKTVCGNVDICPSILEGKECAEIGSVLGCIDCKKKYWSQEVPDDD